MFENVSKKKHTKPKVLVFSYHHPLNGGELPPFVYSTISSILCSSWLRGWGWGIDRYIVYTFPWVSIWDYFTKRNGSPVPHD